MLYLSVIILGVLVDQMVKLLVAAKLPLGAGFAILPGILQIHYVQNTGAAWSMFSDSTFMLGLFSVVMAVLLSVWFIKTPRAKVGERMALCLMISGAVGNMTDRFRLGYVVDFIELPHWPVFNIADMLLCIGVGLLAVLLIGEELAERKKAKGDGK